MSNRKRASDRAKSAKANTAAAHNTDAQTHEIDPGIGTRLRHARLMRGALLREVADAAGCSDSLISKLENNKIQPSLKMLRRICHVLHITVGDLFDPADEEEGLITRAGKRQIVEIDSLRRGRGIRMERLIPYAKGHLLQGNIHIIAAGGSSDGSITHEGEEMIFVLKGEIELTLGEQIFLLREGDCCDFRSEVPHGYRNLTAGEARVMFINTPPTF